MIPMNIVELKKREINQAASVLYEALKDDLMMLWMFGSEDRYKTYGVAAFAIWIKYCLIYGKVYRSEDFAAVMVLRKPGLHHITFLKALRTGLIWNIWQLGKEGFARLEKFEDAANIIKKKHAPDDKYWYAWLLGALPDKQGQGYGSCLLEKAKEIENKSSVPLVLETSSIRAREFYIKHGFDSSEPFKPDSAAPNIYVMTRFISRV